MIVDGVIILYTAEPNSLQMRAYAQRLAASGQQVFLRPLQYLALKRKPAIAPLIQQSLAAIQPN